MNLFTIPAFLKYTYKIILLNFLAISFMLLNSCNNNPVLPPEDQPGRRDYEWTVDTINSYDPIYRIWGSSPTDIWAITSGANQYESFFHFDGRKWSTDGIIRLVSPHSIWGFSSYNIYVGGSDGDIWHYDGNFWNKSAVLTKDGNNNIVFDNIWGESPNDFYAFGVYPDSTGLANNPVIAHFSNNWHMIDTDGLQGMVENLYKNKTDQKIYFRTIKWGNGITRDSLSIYEYYGGKHKRIYSGTWDREYLGEITLINGEVYFIMGRKIAKRIDSNFQTVLDVNLPNFYEGVWGRNSKDIFLSMTDGLAHYNGSNIEYLYHFDKSRTYNFGAVLFEKDVFFLVFESSTHLNLIYHGKLEKGD